LAAESAAKKANRQFGDSGSGLACAATIMLLFGAGFVESMLR